MVEVKKDLESLETKLVSDKHLSYHNGRYVYVRKVDDDYRSKDIDYSQFKEPSKDAKAVVEEVKPKKRILNFQTNFNVLNEDRKYSMWKMKAFENSKKRNFIVYLVWFLTSTFFKVASTVVFVVITIVSFIYFGATPYHTMAFLITGIIFAILSAVMLGYHVFLLF